MIEKIIPFLGYMSNVIERLRFNTYDPSEHGIYLKKEESCLDTFFIYNVGYFLNVSD